MSSFLYKATLPSREVTFSELKMKHLKNLQKSLIGDSNSEIVLLNTNNILKEITNLTENEIQKLDVVDYFILLCYVRSTCIGNIVYAELTQQKNTKLNINVDEISKQLFNINYTKILTEDIFDNITIKYKLPSPHELPLLQTNDIETFCIPFIKSLTFDNNEFIIDEFTTEEKALTVQKLPAKIVSKLYKKVYSLLEIYTKTNLLEHIKGITEFIPFSFNLKSYISLISLLYGDQLLSIYDNIFLLCKFGNFTPDYIESCTPGEYYIFCRKLETYMAKKQEMQQADASTPEQQYSDGFSS